MLKALYDYACRHDLALPAGCVKKTVKAWIHLDAQGSFQFIEPVDNQNVVAPDIGSLANGKDKSNILVEKRSVVLPDEETPKSRFFLNALWEGSGAVRCFISANLAGETGFDEQDLKVLLEAILNMYEHDRSASKGEMSVVSPLILFKHVGTDSDQAQRVRQAKLGCAPAHRLFELVEVKKKAGVEVPRSYRDYDATARLNAVPRGVEMGFLSDPYGEPVWGKLPDGENWFHEG